MTITEAISIAGILVAVFGGLLSLVWSSLMAKLSAIERKQSEIDAKLDAHIQSDTAAHERIKGAEVLLEQTGKKLDDVDARRHRFQANSQQDMNELRQWITETVIAALKS